MRFIYALLISTMALAGCGSGLSSEQKAQRSQNIAQNKSAFEKAKTVSVNGKSFSVAHVTERNQALVNLVSAPAPYFAADVEAASRKATGCNGKLDPGVLAFLGGDMTKADLQALRSKISGKFIGWSVQLSC